MRLDKFITQATNLTRSQAKKMISQKRVLVEGKIVTEAKIKIVQNQEIKLDSRVLSLSLKRYIMLNKPAGYICSTQDEVHPSALKLLDSSSMKDLHFAGRLDVDTTGLVLISDDGQWTHLVTSPKNKCHKIYRVVTDKVIDNSQIEQLTKGVLLKGESKPTLPASVQLINSNEIDLTLYEGRYHQVKRMLAAVGNHVISLHRLQIGEIKLGGLNKGSWKVLSEREISSFKS